MRKNNKYVIFYCDECEQLAGAITLFSDLHPAVDVKTLSEVNHLIFQVRTKMPELIFVYLTGGDERHISVVKEIRKSIAGSAIPVVVHKILPDEKELSELFNRLGK